jgi:hypothetical protein
VNAEALKILGPRWRPLRKHPAHSRLARSTARIDVVEAGRRSGKTEIPKRLGVIEAVAKGPIYAARGYTWFTKFCAPTRDQAKQIYWEDLKRLSQPWWSEKPRENDLFIYLRGGAQIWVCGLDKPQRIEGTPVDRLACDEFAEVKDGSWDRNLYPALGTPGRPPGRAWVYGVPRPGAQFLELVERAKDPNEPEYEYHTWTSEGIVSPKVWAAALRKSDSLLFAQEWCGKRISMEGRAYYAFDEQHNIRALEYQPQLPLVVSLDFNRTPGVAVVSQEQALPGLFVAQCLRCGVDSPGLTGGECKACHNLLPLATCTCVIGEVHIPIASNTTMVCDRLAEKFGHHKGVVLVYGDATGGAKKSSSTEGSDWDLVKRYLERPFPKAVYDVDKSNPSPRARVNSVNLRCCNAAGERRLFVDARQDRAPNTARDLRHQLVLKGTTGELDKDSDKTLGHASDGLGYCIHKLYPAAYGDGYSIGAA